MEMEIIAIENRIELLLARPRDNRRIVAKLQRKLRKLKTQRNGIDE